MRKTGRKLASSKKSQHSSPGIVSDILGVTRQSGVTGQSPFRIKTDKEKKTRETDEVCARTGLPIVAFEKESGKTLCERCVYEGYAKEPVLMAVVAGKITRAFEDQYKEFRQNCAELEEINGRQINVEMQTKVSSFFDLIRSKVDELEAKVVTKVENSQNLGELVGSLENMHSYMEANGIHDKYNRENERISEKIGEDRFTFVCRRKDHFNEVVSDMEEDNGKLRGCITKAKKLIDAILTIDSDGQRIEGTLNDLASALITIDEEHPDFGAVELPEARENPSSTFVNEVQEELKEMKNDVADRLKNFYSIHEGSLVQRSIGRNNKIKTSKICDTENFFQKVVVVP